MTLTEQGAACRHKLRASRDALEVLQGKWRLPIILSLTFGAKRFGEIRKDIEDISPKVLAQELKMPEANKLVSRTELNSSSAAVEYALTPLGESLEKLLRELSDWGIHFRNEILEKV